MKIEDKMKLSMYICKCVQTILLGCQPITLEVVFRSHFLFGVTQCYIFLLLQFLNSKDKMSIFYNVQTTNLTFVDQKMRYIALRNSN